MMSSSINRFLLAFALLFSTVAGAFAQEHTAEGGHEAHAEEKKGFKVGDMITHHISDDKGWEFAHGLTLPLPVILYTADRGVEVFSSSRLAHGEVYNGYKLEHGHVHRVDEAGKPVEDVHVNDFSISKNVASLLISALILFFVFTSIAKSYTVNKGKAPKGLQSFLEPIVMFVRDEIAKPNLGPKYEKYLPYLLTLFFFILVNNLLGLLPGGANLTGNIAVTMVLAVITFFVTNFSGNKHYWMHLVKPTGVPVALLPIMIPVEIVGLFMKPLSLMIRLFANITAGHIIILALLSLIFIAGQASAGTGYGVSLIVVPFTLFMNLIELLVAFLQAFIFTLLTSMYIGSAIEDHHEADHGIGYSGPGDEIG
ncbi:MAG: ATP synthase F0 subunit A [Cytophagaceae bacterium]|nr:MAG: ATP synthase F0 subunit A [Cytophagaceae bacterium]